MKRNKKICKFEPTSLASIQFRVEKAVLRTMQDDVPFLTEREMVVCMLRLRNQAVGVDNALIMNNASLSLLAGGGLSRTPTGYAWDTGNAELNEEIHARLKLRDEMLEELITHQAILENVRAYATAHGIHR